MEKNLTGQFIVLSFSDLKELLEKEVNKILKTKIIPKRWLNEEEAKSLLKIKSRSHLYILRSKGHIAFHQNPSHRKHILYDRQSIETYLLKHRQGEI